MEHVHRAMLDGLATIAAITFLHVSTGAFYSLMVRVNASTRGQGQRAGINSV